VVGTLLFVWASSFAYPRCHRVLLSSAYFSLPHLTQLLPFFPPQVVETLLAAGANPNLSCVWGDTPLFVTAVAGHRCCMQLLLAKGADLYHRNRKDKTVADAVVDELHRKMSGSQRLKLASCLELVITTHACNEAEAHANVVDIEGAAAVVMNPGFELHVVGSQLIPTSSRRSDLSI